LRTGLLIRLPLGAALAVATHSLAASAATQVALVEDVTGKPAGVEFMDYVEAGKVIRLGRHGTLVLSYMTSCVRETITGGTVKVGTEQSEVESGTVSRVTVPCDTGKLDNDQATQFGGQIVRGMAPTSNAATRMLYGRSPIVEVKAPGTLQIARIDDGRENYHVAITTNHLLHGRFYDFARWGKSLAAGGVYSMSMDGEEIVFRIDPHAKPGNTPVLGRLVRLRPSG
jgi:hypothetical protein